MIDHMCPQTISVLKHNVLQRYCDKCVVTSVQQGDSAAFYRRSQQAQFRKDLTQPNQPQQFVRAVGAERAREAGYTEEQIRKYS